MADKDPPVSMSMPIMDITDLSMIGWETGLVMDGTGRCGIQATCGNCGTAHYILFPPGGKIQFVPGQGLVANDLEWGGPYVGPPVREEPGLNIAPQGDTG